MEIEWYTVDASASMLQTIGTIYTTCQEDVVHISQMTNGLCPRHLAAKPGGSDLIDVTAPTALLAS